MEERVPTCCSRDLVSLRAQSDQAIKTSQSVNEIQYAKRSVLPLKYEIGDFVVMKNVDSTVGRNKKFIPKYRGPYVVHRILPHDRYLIRDVDNCQLTQLPYKWHFRICSTKAVDSEC